MYSVLQTQIVWTLNVIMLRQKKKEVPFYFHLGLSFQNNLTVTMPPPFQLQLITIINKGQSCQLNLGCGMDKILIPSPSQETALFQGSWNEFNVFITHWDLPSPFIKNINHWSLDLTWKSSQVMRRCRGLRAFPERTCRKSGSRETLAFPSPDLWLFCIQLALTAADLQVNMVSLPDKKQTL